MRATKAVKAADSAIRVLIEAVNSAIWDHSYNGKVVSEVYVTDKTRERVRAAVRRALK